MPNDRISPATDPFTRVWRRYGKARGAKTGLVLVAAFTLLAFLAPFLAHRLPFFWYDYETSQLTWPLLREFLAPSDTTEPLLEKGINFLFVFIPLAILSWRLMNKWFPGLARRESRLIALFFGALFAAAMWLSVGGMVVQGGGADWFHYEKAPVPDVDDFQDLGRLQQNGDTGTKSPAREFVDNALTRQRANRAGTTTVHDTDPTESGGTPESRRVLIADIQDIIDGPALTAVDSFARENGVETHDIHDGNLALGINAARWNRILVETAYPGLLMPMRQFRSAFVTLAAACLLALLGLSYIFLAGAYQFALSPRWLVLVGLSALIALPFQLIPRHDHTQYRSLSAEGRGFGIFPLIPYGPNEQGFGPRLPPSWFAESPLLAMDTVHSWGDLVDGLEHPQNPSAEHAAAFLTAELPEWPKMADEMAGRWKILAALNRLLEKGGLADTAELQNYRSDLALSPYVREVQSGRDMTPLHREQMNRLLLEKALPRTFKPATAIRWKKPHHHAGTHVFGTDESGRDVLVRIIHGARVSLSVGFVSVFLATVIGLVLGSLAAYYGGRIDMLISRFLEIMMCFPSFFLILAVIAVLDKRSIVNIMLVIGLTSWTGVARLVRGEILRQKKMEYVSASIALGASDTRTIFRQILPNAMAPVLVSISFGITGAILTEASLSFIGFGVTPPTPTWGQLLSETRDSPLANWWLAVFPGVVLFLSVLAYNMVGEALRDALDPRTTL